MCQVIDSWIFAGFSISNDLPLGFYIQLTWKELILCKCEANSVEIDIS